MNQPRQQIPGLGQRRQTPDAVDIVPGLSLLSRRGEAPTDFMDQHSQQIPGLGQDSQDVGVPAMADVIAGLSNFSRGGSNQPLQQPSLGMNSDIDMADIIPGLSLQRSQQVSGLHQCRGEMVDPNMAPGPVLHLQRTSSHSSTPEEIWRTEMLISEEELRHAINVLLEQPLEDVEAFGSISTYIFHVVLPHASNSRNIYHTLCVYFKLHRTMVADTQKRWLFELLALLYTGKM
ncbi:hypothetical protein B0H14DRAFT_3125705 [Mycena olivaceomarginata]|nr:hypothetical protein B0H14DRAFT_3125705 [Mycena olivaceomarginata]